MEALYKYSAEVAEQPYENETAQDKELFKAIALTLSALILANLTIAVGIWALYNAAPILWEFIIKHFK